MPPYARTREWNIFGWLKKNQSSAVPIRLLANKKSFCAFVKNIMDNIVLTFEWFLLTSLSARSNLVIISQKKNLTSNRSKPIGVLTRTKSSCSDERLPISYLLRTFQPNRSNFLNQSLHFTSLQFNQVGRGSTHWGGSRPPKPPRGGRANETLINPADVL